MQDGYRLETVKLLTNNTNVLSEQLGDKHTVEMSDTKQNVYLCFVFFLMFNTQNYIL